MLTALLLMSAQPALAWTHTEYAWLPEDLPREWWMDDDVEDSLPEGYQLKAVVAGWDAWEVPEAGCAGLSNTYMGMEDFGSPSTSDGLTVFYWDDPSDDLAPGVLGLTVYPVASDTTITVNGENYDHYLDTDIIFNNDVDWGTSEDIGAGVCNGEISVIGVATHEIGHSWGMGHSCEQGDSCTDSVLRNATMYWSVGACDLGQDDLNQDDISGISAIYGPYGTFTATGDRYGGTPLEVCFEATSEDEIESVLWTFGDGETSTENPTCHTYTTAGQYTVKSDIAVTSPACGDDAVHYEATELGYVRACEPPAPEADAQGFFEITHVEGLTYQTLNHVDTSVYGCTDTIQWEIYRGGDASAITPENLVDFTGDGTGDSIGAWAPEITFPEEGSFVVVMNVGGPGGLDANYLVVEAQDQSSGGCSSAPSTAAMGAGALLLAGLATLRRRRA